MPVDETASAMGTDINAASNTVSGQDYGSGNGANASLKGTEDAAGYPSIDWDAVRSHPEFKTHVKSTLEADEEFRKEASRGVRTTDVEKRAQERAKELSADTERRAIAAEARATALEQAQEQARLSTMTFDEQETYKLQKALTDANARLEQFETARNKAEAASAVEDIIGYAQREWGLNDENAATLRGSTDSIDLMDKALKAATRQWNGQKSQLDGLRTKVDAQGRVLDGTSTFAATGSTGAGGDMSDDEIADAYSRTGPSSPNYAKVRAAYEKVYRRRGY